MTFSSQMFLNFHYYWKQ